MLETHYTIQCRMSIGDDYHVCGWAKGEDNLKKLVEGLKLLVILSVRGVKL